MESKMYLFLVLLVVVLFLPKYFRLVRMKRLAKLMGLEFSHSPYTQQLRSQLVGVYKGHNLIIRDSNRFLAMRRFGARTRIKVDEKEIADQLVQRSLGPKKIIKLVDDYIVN